MYLPVKKMIKDNKLIYFILANFLFLNIAFRCSQGKFINTKITEEIRTLRKSDLISVELVNQQKLNGVFLKNEGSSIIIGTKENGIMTQKLIPIDSIYIIQKQGEKSTRHSNILITFGLLIVFLGLLGGAMLLSHIGSSY